MDDLNLLAAARIARGLYNNLYSVDANGARTFDVNCAIVTFVEYTGSQMFFKVFDPIGFAKVCGAATGNATIAIRVLYNEIRGGVNAPFGQSTVGEYYGNIIGGGKSAIFIYGFYRALGVRGDR